MLFINFTLISTTEQRHSVSVLISSTVPSAPKVLIISIHSNHRRFETKRDTSDMHIIKSLDLHEIYQFYLEVFVVTIFALKLWRFELE